MSENRRSSDGRALGRRARDDRSYEERQLAAPDSDAPADVQGNGIEGP